MENIYFTYLDFHGKTLKRIPFYDDFWNIGIIVVEVDILCR